MKLFEVLKTLFNLPAENLALLVAVLSLVAVLAALKITWSVLGKKEKANDE